MISYDRLIMESDAVTYYTTFDNYYVGMLQGQYIIDQLGLDHSDRSYNIELITGDSRDGNVPFYYYGALDVLQPYINSGKLVVRSGQMDINEVATQDWSSENAQARFEKILSKYYSDGTRLDAVMASNDSTAQGVVAALGRKYDVGKYGWPVLTGQDCDILSVKYIKVGRQSMSVIKDTRDLVLATVEMADAIMRGREPKVNDTVTYDNGTGVIPALLCESRVVTEKNYKELLIDSGYYTESDLQ